MEQKYMKFFKNNKKIILVLFSAYVLRLGISFFGTLQLDQGTFIAWSNILVHDGFKNFYNSWSDYLPGYLYFLWGLGKINLLGVYPEQILYKIPGILADVITGLFIYKILLKSKGERWGIIGAAVYLFNPAIFANSSLWGQVDSLTSLASILTVFCFSKFYILSSIFLAIGTLIKPQTAFIFPVILFLFIKNKRKFSDLLLYCFIGLTVFTLGFVPFWNHGNLATFIFERLGLSANQYPFTSVNAFNFWGLLGQWRADNLYFQIGGYMLVLSLLIFLFVKLRKVKNPEYYLLSFVFAASFMFFTRMHERHLLPVFAPLVIVAIENPILLIPYIGFSLTYIANLYYSYIWISDNFRQAISDFTVKFLEVANISFVVFIFYVIVRNLKMIWKKISFSPSKEYKLPKINLSGKKAKLILVAILAIALITRIIDLKTPPTMYFDEVYHAFTAKIMMGEDRAKAWEWWNSPPEGFAYEWTHPPLAKLGMVLGMTIFGQNSFGWRIPGVILGVGSIFLVYLLAKTIFKDKVVGLLSAFAFSLDGLFLVMNRIGMNDSYILFFSLLSIYLFIKKKDFGSSIAFGLAIASKWSAIWAIPILGILWLKRKKKFKLSLLWFLLLPFAIYLLSYLPMFLTGHDFSIWWGMQKQMWWYHTGLVATHPYTSMWWSWPLLVRSIYLYTSEEVGGMVSRIYAFGNPVIFWFGLVSVVSSMVYAYIERNKRLAFVVFCYLIFFVPWALSPRIMFLYHYLPSIPFLAIAIGYILRRFPKLVYWVLGIGLLVFIYFYPHWAGLNIPLWLDRSYYWVSSWR
jgi:predicted membrane-bound dolichyl-phosphate-mannose-protein mannosyltransferase